jgi:hypothetical protein
MFNRGGKPTYAIWKHWSEVLAARLRIVASVYQEYSPQHAHTGDPRARQMEAVAAQLIHIFEPAKLDPGLPVFQTLEESRKVEDMKIFLAVKIFREILKRLPFISSEMQHSLDCSWKDPIGRLATDLFKGPKGFPDYGILSGKPEDGGLPAVMKKLLELEDGEEDERHNGRRLHSDMTAENLRELYMQTPGREASSPQEGPQRNFQTTTLQNRQLDMYDFKPR